MTGRSLGERARSIDAVGVESWVRSPGPDVRTHWPGLESDSTVSGQGTCPLQLERSGAQICRRRKSASDRPKEPVREGIQFPRVTAQAFARASDRRNPDATSQTQRSSYLRPVARRVRFPTSALPDRAPDRGIIRRAHRNPPPPQPSGDGVAKPLAGLERRRVRGRDGDALAGAGIAAAAGRARSRREGSEAGDLDGLATAKRLGDGGEHGTHGCVGVRLGQRSSGGDVGSEVGPVHSGPPAVTCPGERTTLPEIVVEGIALRSTPLGSSWRGNSPHASPGLAMR